MDSTSRPTYPTSVNFEASTFVKGESVSLDRRREISVFPTPVGPMRIMFLGAISSRRSSGTCCRRHRFLRAMETERFALSWPMMYLSSCSTISDGVWLLINAFLHLFDSYGFIGIDTYGGCDFHRVFHDAPRIQVRVLHECGSRRLGTGSSGAYPHDALVGFDHIAIA